MKKLSGLTIYISTLMETYSGPVTYEAAVTYERGGASITDIHNFEVRREANLEEFFQDVLRKVNEVELSDFGEIKTLGE